ncbi:MAG: hypothetical protein J5I93_00475 [Pirellulaceae bacterium]|nr:hypothetical protein [Pirellulaceae bacterium]
MPCELVWRGGVAASALHAANWLLQGRALVSARLEEAVREPAERLEREIEHCNVDPREVWLHLVRLSATAESRFQRAEGALRKAGLGPEQSQAAAEQLARPLADLETAHQQAFPDLEQELRLRGGPLQQHWEARGPGLLRALGRRTSEELLVPRAEVILLQPALGGSGQALLPYNTVLLEALLANPHAELPEVVRLAWLVAQLHLDLPVYSERVSPRRLPWVAGLALLPAVLEAAAYVELARADDQTLLLALSAWGLDAAAPDGSEPPATLELVRSWWTTYSETRPEWSLALLALDRMLDELRPS